MTEIKARYYNAQVKRILIQFMAIFGGMEVEVGKTGDTEKRLIKVPIGNASKDRVVAFIKGDNTHNKPIRLPTMSAAIIGLEMAPHRRHGIGSTRRHTYMPVGGEFPTDISVVEQRMPVPYDLKIELGIWASNQDQHMQILEPILSIFDPILQIQTSDDIFDVTKITTVELDNVRFDENLPAGNDRRLIQTFLDFTVPIYLSLPADVHNRYVRDIFVRVGAVSTDSLTSEEMVADLDNQNIDYELWWTLDGIDTTEFE